MTYVIIDNTKDLEAAEMTPLLIRYFQDRGHEPVIISHDEDLDSLTNYTIRGIILSGGPILLSSRSEIFRYSKNFRVLLEYTDTPILGICFGFQLIGVAYGGRIRHLGDAKRDRVEECVTCCSESLLFKGYHDILRVYQCHQDHLYNPPANFDVTSRNNDGIIQAIEDLSRLRFGVQFHPENSPDGHIVLDNFLSLCEAKKVSDEDH